MGEVTWWMVGASPEPGGGGDGAAPVVAHVVKDDVGRLTGLAADARTPVQVSLGCGLALKPPAFPAPLLLSGHPLAFGMAGRLAWEHLMDSDQCLSDALFTSRFLASAHRGNPCPAHGSKPDQCPGRINHTQRRRFRAERVQAAGNGGPEYE